MHFRLVDTDNSMAVPPGDANDAQLRLVQHGDKSNSQLSSSSKNTASPSDFLRVRIIENTHTAPVISPRTRRGPSSGKRVGRPSNTKLTERKPVGRPLRLEIPDGRKRESGQYNAEDARMVKKTQVLGEMGTIAAIRMEDADSSLSVMESPHYLDSFLSAQWAFQGGIQLTTGEPQETRALFAPRGLCRPKESALILLSMERMEENPFFVKFLVFEHRLLPDGWAIVLGKSFFQKAKLWQ